MEIRLLIVDDEPPIRYGLTHGIAWDTLGVGQVFSAENGDAALAIMQQEQIHILLTDIRMPGMSGLDLATVVRRDYPDTKIIILSGYSEFEYAKQAIGIGVVDYLLKPIDTAELERLIRRQCQEIGKQAQQTHLHNTAKQRAELERLLLQSHPDEVAVEHIWRDYIGGITGNVVGVMIDFDNKDKTQRIDFSAFEAGFPQEGLLVSLVIGCSTLMIYATNHSRPRYLILNGIQTAVQKWNIANRPNSISASVTSIRNAGELLRLKEDAVMLLEHRLYLGKSVVIDGEVTRVAPMARVVHDTETIRGYLLAYDSDTLIAWLKNQFSTFKEQNIASTEAIRDYCKYLIRLLREYVYAMETDVSEILRDCRLEGLPEFVTLEEYCNWVCEMYRSVLHRLNDVNRTVSLTISRGMSYVSSHYAENITVEDVASYVMKSKNYFSHLFKKETGVAFNEYLNRYRIEKAKRLLDSSLELAGEIGKMVGFNDERYFSIIFKKFTGETPTSYRKKKRL